MYASSLQNSLSKLVAKVQGLHTISAISFFEPNGNEVEAALRVVRQDSTWTLVDAVAAGSMLSERLETPLREAPVLVIRVRATNGEVAVEIDLLIRAIVDQQLTDISLGSGPTLSRRADQSVVLLVDGLKDPFYAGVALQRVPYWDKL